MLRRSAEIWQQSGVGALKREDRMQGIAFETRMVIDRIYILNLVLRNIYMVQRRNPHPPPPRMVYGGYTPPPLWPCGGPAVLAYMHACIHTTTSMQCIASSSKPRFQDHTIRGGGCGDPRPGTIHILVMRI